MASIIQTIHGRCIPLPGNDIDTDQIIESRYLKMVTFQGIEKHLFQSRRAQARASEGPPHPLDDPRFASGRILLVNRNFGCGSSREHAPQAIRRFGIRAIIGESFGEIFAGNCLAIGLPCLPVNTEDAQWLQQQCKAAPQTELTLDINLGMIDTGCRQIQFDLPEGRRRRLLDGTWSSLEVLISRQEQVNARLFMLPSLQPSTTQK